MMSQRLRLNTFAVMTSASFQFARFSDEIFRRSDKSATDWLMRWLLRQTFV